MVKDVFSSVKPAALTFVGWITFVVGVLVSEPLVVKLALLGVARVLPQALRFRFLQHYLNITGLSPNTSLQRTAALRAFTAELMIRPGVRGQALSRHLIQQNSSFEPAHST